MLLFGAKLTERFAVPIEIFRRVIADAVLLQKRIHLHARLKPQQPSKLGRGKCLGAVSFERKAFESGARQILPLCLQAPDDVFRQFQGNLHGNESIISGPKRTRGHPPDFDSLWRLWAVAIAVFVLGHGWFYKLRKTFADII